MKTVFLFLIGLLAIATVFSRNWEAVKPASKCEPILNAVEDSIEKRMGRKYAKLSVKRCKKNDQTRRFTVEILVSYYKIARLFFLPPSPILRGGGGEDKEPIAQFLAFFLSTNFSFENYFFVIMQ